jgi:hypothetical protein
MKFDVMMRYDALQHPDGFAPAGNRDVAATIRPLQQPAGDGI